MPQRDKYPRLVEVSEGVAFESLSFWISQRWQGQAFCVGGDVGISLA